MRHKVAKFLLKTALVILCLALVVKLIFGYVVDHCSRQRKRKG